LYKFPLCYTDTVKEYYTSGVLKQKSLYSNNQVISNEIWNEDGTKFMDNVFTSADESPKFPGGNSELYKIVSEKLIYPNQARRDNIQGKVLVRFVIMEDGSIDGVTITKSAAQILDEAALEMVKSIKTKWNPAKINGTSVRVFCTLPIKFSLK
jgi:TonB family protein